MTESIGKHAGDAIRFAGLSLVHTLALIGLVAGKGCQLLTNLITRKEGKDA